MLMWLRPQRVRLRLTLWYVAILAAILLTYGFSASAFVFLQLRSEMDQLAAEDLEHRRFSQLRCHGPTLPAQRFS